MGNIHSYDKHFSPKVMDPIAQQSSANTAWELAFADDAMANRWMAEINFGAIGTSLDAKVTQAQDSSGTGAKDVTGAALTQILTALQNGLATIDIGPGALDDKNGFKYVRVEVTVVGTTVWGVNTCRYDLRNPGKLAQDATYRQQVRVYDV